MKRRQQGRETKDPITERSALARSDGTGGPGNAALARRVGLSNQKGLADLETSFGMEEGTTRLHIGTGVAEGHGAAGLAVGQDVHIADAAVDVQGQVEPNLLAHEVAHVAQATSGLKPGGGDAEAEAHQMAAHAMGGGDPIEPGVGIAAGGHAWSFGDWFRGWFEDKSPKPAIRHTDANSEGVTHLGTSHPVVDTSEPDMRQRRLTSGSYDTSSDTGNGITGERSRQSSYLDVEDHRESGGGIQRTEGSSGGFLDLANGIFGTNWSFGQSETHTDGLGDAEKVSSTIQTRLESLDGELGTLNSELAGLDPGASDYSEKFTELSSRIDHAERTQSKLQAQQPRALALAESGRLLREKRAELARVEASLAEGGDVSLETLQATKERLAEEIRQMDLQLSTEAGQVAQAAEVLIEESTYSVGRSSSGRDYIDVDLDSGRLGTVTERKEGTQSRDGSTERSSSTNEYMQLDGGIQRGRSTTDSSTVTDASGNSTVTSDSRDSSQGFVARGEDEFGWGGRSSTSSSTVEKDADGNVISGQSSSASGRADLTNKGVYTSGEVGGGSQTRNGSKSFKLGGHFNLTLDVVTQPGGLYHLLLVVDMGESIGGDLTGKTDEHTSKDGNKSQGTIGAGGSASANQKMTFTRELSADEAEIYLGQIDRAQDGSVQGDLPEFGLLQRLYALSDSDTIGTLADSALTASLERGDSLEIELGTVGEIHGSLGGSTGSLGVEAEGSASDKWTRVLKAEKVLNAAGQERLRVTLSIVDRNEMKAKGSMSYGAAGAGRGFSKSGGDGATLSVDLDPAASNYDALYGRIVAIQTVTDLNTLAQDEQIAGLVNSRSLSSHEGQGDSVDMNIGPVSLAGNQNSTMDIDTTWDANSGLSEDSTGQHTMDGALSVGGWETGKDTTQTTATTHVDRDGAEVVIQTEDTESGWLTGTPAGSEQDTTWNQYFDSPKTQLQRILTGARKEIWGISLNDSAIDILGDRAKSKLRWTETLGPASRVGTDWHALREKLANPGLPSEFAQLVPADQQADADLVRVGLRITQARGLASFISVAGEEGQGHLYNALRHWNSQIGEVMGVHEDAGFLFQWPAELVHLKPGFDQLATEVEKLEGLLERYQQESAELGGVSPNPETRSSIEALFPFGMMQGAESLRSEIERSDAFTLGQAKVEMLNKLGEFSEISMRAINFDVEVDESSPLRTVDTRTLGVFRSSFAETCKRLDDELDDFFVDKWFVAKQIEQLEEILEGWCTEARKLGVELGEGNEGTPTLAEVQKVEYYITKCIVMGEDRWQRTRREMAGY